MLNYGQLKQICASVNKKVRNIKMTKLSFRQYTAYGYSASITGNYPMLRLAKVENRLPRKFKCSSIFSANNHSINDNFPIWKAGECRIYKQKCGAGWLIEG